MNNQATIFSLKCTSFVEMFDNENYLDEPQNTKFKRTIINFLKELKEFKDKTKNQLIEIKNKEHKKNNCLTDVQETTDIRLVEMIKIIQDSINT